MDIKFLIFLFPAVWDNSVVKLLKAEYKRRSLLRPLLWDSTIELPLENVYTRLKIVSRRKLAIQVKDDKVNAFNSLKAPFKGEDVTTLADLLDGNRANVFESVTVPDKIEDVVSPAEGGNADVLREHDEVNVFEIFKTLEKGEDVMTLVEGSPGIGKTTFCLKLAYDWAHGKIPSECSFPKFEFVLLLKCRDIDGNIMDTIREQLLPRDIDEETVEKLLHFMKDIHNQEKILIILDGLDELPEKSQCHVDELLHRRILPFCYVLATSRQERGIDVRKRFVFDIHLEIKGFTERDAFEYIRKHFANIGRGHSPKGERLITEIKDNEFLHALRSNPLNLLLLCVIYEDYEGKLPSSRSKLYQVIVLCLLRRYCAKHNLQLFPKDDNALEKYFEKDILALGELAWMCLLSDRHGFRETELAELEKRYKGLVSRHIGLVYKEESLKRLTPQHEYYFLHKTFQEYLAAAYVAYKLRRNQLNLFERLNFYDLVDKYRQVFLFVSGILGTEASILFTQIGEELKNRGEWNWIECRQSRELETLLSSIPDLTATFLTESFNESRHAEKMAVTLCSYIPFPRQVDINLSSNRVDNIFHVLEACKRFRNLQRPVELTFCVERSNIFQSQSIAWYIQSCPKTQKLSLFTRAVTLDLAKGLQDGLFGNTTLSEFTLQISDSIPCNAAVLIGELLAARRSLRKVTFQLDRVWDENWASVIEPALSADTPLNSVDLQVRGSLSDTAVCGLGKLLSNKALASFSLNISGDVQEFVAAVISKGIVQQTALKAFTFSVDGNLSLPGLNVLQRSLLENRSLSDIELTLRGEIPGNWQSVMEKLRLVRKNSVNYAFHPDPGSCFTCRKVAHFRPAVVENELETEQHLTVVIWGELKCDGAEALCEVLGRVPLTSLTLKVYGKLRDGVANIIERYVRQNTLSSLTIDIWGELALGTGTLLRELSRNNEIVQVKEHGVSGVPNEVCNALDVYIDSPASLIPKVSELKNTKNEKINLRIINDGKVIGDWPRLLGDALTENKLLTTLDLTVSNCTLNSQIGKDLWDSLLRSSSLTVLSLTISNYNKMAEGWEYSLVNSLAKMASLATLTLAIDDRGEGRKFDEDLMAVRSLSTLSVEINGRNLTYFWGKFLRKCLEECNSLTKLCVTSNNFAEHEQYNQCDANFGYRFSDNSRDMPVSWVEGQSKTDLGLGLVSTSSLKELNMTINNITFANCTWIGDLIQGLSENTSLTSLTVTVNDYLFLSYELWVCHLKSCLAKSKSLTTFTLTLNEYSEGEWREDWLCLWNLRDDFPENTSLTELDLTVNIRSEVSEDWLPLFCDYLMMKCSSLRTMKLQVNNRCASSKSRIYDLSELRLKYRSLSTFELSVTFYGE